MLKEVGVNVTHSCTETTVENDGHCVVLSAHYVGGNWGGTIGGQRNICFRTLELQQNNEEKVFLLVILVMKYYK